MCLLPKLFSTMYFMYYAWTFDGMKFKYLKFWNLIILKMKKATQVK